MTLPKLLAPKRKNYAIKEFGGINRNGDCTENQFYDSCNVNSGKYPALTTRGKRYKLDEINIGTADFIGYFENNGIRVLSEDNDHEFTIGKSGNANLGLIELNGSIHNGNAVKFDNKTLIMSEGKGYEINYIDGVSEMNVKYTVSYARENDDLASTRASMYLTILYEDKVIPSGFSRAGVSDEFPANVQPNHCFQKNGKLYRMITQGDNGGVDAEWEEVDYFCIKMTLNAAKNKFKDGDYIKISGLKYWNWIVTPLDCLDGYFRISTTSNAAEIITEPIAATIELASFLQTLTYPTNNIYGYTYPILNNTGNLQPILEGELTNEIPNLNFICTTGNRVWGCSKEKNEIYASQLGNPRSWYDFEGLSSDSYAVKTASKGKFTACCNYLGNPVFFKEDEMIILSGGRPSSFSIKSCSCRGVNKDSPDGVLVHNDILFYKAYDGIYAYSGGMPSCISGAIGDEMKRLTDVKISGKDTVLYICGKIGNECRLYIYDIKRKIWHRYSPDNIIGFVGYYDGIAALCQNNGKVEIWSIDADIPSEFSSAVLVSSEQSWFWESNEISYSTAKRKYISQIEFEMECEKAVSVYIKYDNENKYRQIKRVPPIKRQGVYVKIRPRRCHHFSIRMQGEGQMTLYNILKEVEVENG